MRIGVVSDSHGDLYMLDRAVNLMGNVDIVFHLGDHYKDIIKLNSKYKHVIDYVVGNNDYAGLEKYDKVLEVNEKRILLTHGHRYNVNYGLMNLQFKAKEDDADIVLYGHTHVYGVENYQDILYINPGSVSRPRDGCFSAAILNFDDKGEVYVEKIAVKI